MFKMFNTWSQDRKFNALVVVATLLLVGVFALNQGCKKDDESEDTPTVEAPADDDDSSTPAKGDDDSAKAAKPDATKSADKKDS